MRVFWVTDLEGVAGVINAAERIHAESKYKELAKELLTKEVNTAVDGFLQPVQQMWWFRTVTAPAQSISCCWTPEQNCSGVGM